MEDLEVIEDGMTNNHLSHEQLQYLLKQMDKTFQLLPVFAGTEETVKRKRML